MPVVVKRWFPHRIGPMTGLYSMGLALGTSCAAAVTVPMTTALGGSWRAGLGAWALLGVLAALPWLDRYWDVARDGEQGWILATLDAIVAAATPGDALAAFSSARVW